MFDLLVILSIIYLIYKKYNNSPSKITTILQNKGFHNIFTVQQNPSSYWMSASLHGENYLLQIMKTGNNVSTNNIHTLAEYATKAHYHNVILIPGNCTISKSAKTVISEYSIQIWDNTKLNEFSLQNSQTTSAQTMASNKFENSTSINHPDDPIQDGKKANSFLANFFGNKPEKL